MWGGIKSKQPDTPVGRRPRDSTAARVSRTEYYHGSSSEPVRAAQANRSRGYSQQDSTLNTSTFASKFLNILVTITLLVCLCYSLWLAPRISVRTNSESYHSQAQYESGISKLIGGIADQSKLTFNAQRLQERTKQLYPEVSAMTVSTSIFSHEPQVNILVSQPRFILISQGMSYVLDDTGKVVALQSGFKSITSGLPKITDQSGFHATVGKQVLTNADIVFITTLTTQLNIKHIEIKQLQLGTSAEELHLLTTDRPYYAKFFTGGDALQQIGAFLAARQKFDSQTSKPEQYIDLRVEEKIFYK